MSLGKRDDTTRRGHALLTDAPPDVQAKFMAAIDDADDLALDEASEGVYFIYEINVRPDEDGDDE